MPDFLPGANAHVEELRRFASVKLVVADLDGTLFPSDLAATAQRLLRQLNHAGVRLTVATGRTFTGVRGMLDKLQNDSQRPLIRRGTPLILYNGSIVVEALTTQLLRRRTIGAQSLAHILRIVAGAQCQVYSYFCDQEALPTDDEVELRETVLAWSFGKSSSARASVDVNGLPIVWDALLPVDLAPCAVLLTSSEPSELVRLSLALQIVDGITATRSGSTYIELRPQDSNKGSTLAWVARHLGLTPDEVLTVGDNDNDVEMLSWAGTGVAVSTASVSACRQADFICQFGPFQGVVEVLRLVHQAHRYFPTRVTRSAS